MIKEILQALRQLFMWFVIVTPWEQGVRVRLGKRVRVLRAGVHLRIPIIDQIYRQSVRHRTCIVPAVTLTTTDGVAITIGSYIGYSISDVHTLYNTLHDAEQTIESMAISAMSEFVTGHPRVECTPKAIETHVNSSVDLAKYGLSGTEFFISNFAAVRTVRLITGEIKQWSTAERIDTNRTVGTVTP